MNLIEQIKADRDAGTPGRWSASGSRGRENIYGHRVDADSCAGLAFVAYSDRNAEEHRAALADLRRIARLPDMEAALLAAEELAEALCAYQSFEAAAADVVDDGASDGLEEYAAVFEGWERVEIALSAYRKATGGAA